MKNPDPTILEGRIRFFFVERSPDPNQRNFVLKI